MRHEQREADERTGVINRGELAALEGRRLAPLSTVGRDLPQQTMEMFLRAGRTHDRDFTSTSGCGE